MIHALHSRNLVSRVILGRHDVLIDRLHTIPCNFKMRLLISGSQFPVPLLLLLLFFFIALGSKDP